MTLFLVGFMGCGKSTLGERLAAERELLLYDTDKEVEKAFGLSISEIFAQYGEEAFREKETEVLRAAPGSNCIVVTGGGLPCHHNNMQWMLEHGRVIWLNTDAETVFNRLKNREDREKRPLLRGKSDEELRTFITAKMKEREPYYRLAHEVRGTD